MKTRNSAVVTFGVRGGRLSGQHVLPIGAAARMARDLVHVLGAGPGFSGADSGGPERWRVSRRMPMQSWQSSSHYVSVQLLTGTGDASALLWKPEGRE